MRPPKARLSLLDLMIWYLERIRERGIPQEDYQPVMKETILHLNTLGSAAGKRQYVVKTLGGFIDEWSEVERWDVSHE